MELDELKNIWQTEYKNLDSRIRINEKHLLKMNMEKATLEIDKIIRTSVTGRNMALIFCFASIGMAVSIIEEIEYSIPAIIGALAMLWSFISHLSIEKPNYKDSIVQLQKTICTFRIHLAANFKYDMVITALWFITAQPIILKSIFNISVYNNNNQQLASFCLIGGVVLTLIIALSRKAYTEYDRHLETTESYLAELIKFEKTT